MLSTQLVCCRPFDELFLADVPPRLSHAAAFDPAPLYCLAAPLSWNSHQGGGCSRIPFPLLGSDALWMLQNTKPVLCVSYFACNTPGMRLGTILHPHALPYCFAFTPAVLI